MDFEQATSNSKGMVVSILQPDGTYTHRPACFLLPAAGGFRWVEPAAFDAPGAMSAPALHAFEGETEYVGDGVWSLRGSFDGQLTPYLDEDRPLVGEALEWWLKTWLPADGRSIGELRAWVLEQGADA